MVGTTPIDDQSASVTALQGISSNQDDGVEEGDPRLGRYVLPQELPPAPPASRSGSEKPCMRAAA